MLWLNSIAITVGLIYPQLQYVECKVLGLFRCSPFAIARTSNWLQLVMPWTHMLFLLIEHKMVIIIMTVIMVILTTIMLQCCGLSPQTPAHWWWWWWCFGSNFGVHLHMTTWHQYGNAGEGDVIDVMMLFTFSLVNCPNTVVFFKLFYMCIFLSQEKLSCHQKKIRKAVLYCKLDSEGHFCLHTIFLAWS